MPDERTDSRAEESSVENEATGESSSKQLPEGMRVVRKRRKKRGNSRQTLFLKKREILRDMHDESVAVGVKEQVERLRTARKAKDAEKPMEEEWGGTGARHRGMRWFVLRVFAIVIPVLAIVTAFVLTKGKGGDKQIAYDPELDLGKNEAEEVRLPYDPTGPIAWFNDHPHVAYESGVGILEKLNELESGRIPEDLLRNDEIVRPKIADRGIGWTSPYYTAEARKLFWSTGEAGDTGFIVLEGRRENHERFRSYFVKTPGGLRLDWEASTGWCEVPFERLATAPPALPVLMRARLAKEAHFDVYAREDEIVQESWYLLRNADNSEHVWGHVPAGGRLDRQLLDLFRFGWVILERLDEVRVTVRLGKSQSASRPNEFEIVDIVAEDWLLP